MAEIYARDLDLNLLRVFLVVAESGSVTEAAQRLYLTQPAVSAALRRLTERVGSPLFTRAGRGLTLSARGQQLVVTAKPHLSGLIAAALSPAVFDPKTSDATIRLGLSDINESWLLPPLLRELGDEAPNLRLIVSAVQFRTVGEALSLDRIDAAVAIADDLPAGMQRQALFTSDFVCLFDPAHVRLPKRLSLERYLAEAHAVVSYNGDLRGVVEDVLGIQRRVRLSVPSFQSLGWSIEGTPLLATVPRTFARQLLRIRPNLRSVALPFEISGTPPPMELIWRETRTDDPALTFIRERVASIAQKHAKGQ